MNMIDSDLATQHLLRVEVVHGEDGAALVHVAEEAITFALPSVVITNEIDVNLVMRENLVLQIILQESIFQNKSESHRFTILRKHTDHVSLSHLVRQSTKKYPGRVLVLVVPGVLGARHPRRQLLLIHLHLVQCLRERIHCEYSLLMIWKVKKLN